MIYVRACGSIQNQWGQSVDELASTLEPVLALNVLLPLIQARKF